MGLEATYQEALLHGRIQQNGTHAWHCELVSHKALQDVSQQVAVLLEAATLLEDQSSEFLQGQGLQIRMLLPPMVLQSLKAA